MKKDKEVMKLKRDKYYIIKKSISLVGRFQKLDGPKLARVVGWRPLV